MAAGSVSRRRSSRRQWRAPSSKNSPGPSRRRHFTVGITDDVTNLSLELDETADLEPAQQDVTQAVFFGLGSDGTVGANKNTIKIIGEDTPNFAQGYFVYDSKKAGAITISHLRFGPRPIRSTYLIAHADVVACHQYDFLDKYDVLGVAKPGGVFLLNSPHDANEVWDRLPAEVQAQIIREVAAVLRHRCVRRGARDGHGLPDQHHHAGLLLRDFRRASARGRDRAASSTRSRRPTASAATTSSPRTSMRSIERWRG